MELYKKAINPIFGGNMWLMNPNAWIMEKIPYLIDCFVKEYYHTNWSLSVYDINEEQTAEIDCKPSEIKEVMGIVCSYEHISEMSFIGENPITKSYVVGVACTRGCLKLSKCYRYDNGKLVLLHE